MKEGLSTKCSLSQERSNEIAHALAEYFLRENFRVVAANEYRRRLGHSAQIFGQGITTDELHQFLLDKLPKVLGDMFGWNECGITGHRGY